MCDVEARDRREARDRVAVTLLTAERGETVRAQPFDAIELAVGTRFGDDPPV